MVARQNPPVCTNEFGVACRCESVCVKANSGDAVPGWYTAKSGFTQMRDTGAWFPWEGYKMEREKMENLD